MKRYLGAILLCLGLMLSVTGHSQIADQKTIKKKKTVPGAIAEPSKTDSAKKKATSAGNSISFNERPEFIAAKCQHWALEHKIKLPPDDVQRLHNLVTHYCTIFSQSKSAESKKQIRDLTTKKLTQILKGREIDELMKFIDEFYAPKSTKPAKK